MTVEVNSFDAWFDSVGKEMCRNGAEGAWDAATKCMESKNASTVLRLRALLQRVLDWRGLDGDGITDPLRLEIADALDGLPVTIMKHIPSDFAQILEENASSIQ